jgi:hypothetical protein
MRTANQASEDELHELLIKKLNTKKRMIEPHDERFVIGFQTKVPGDDVDWQYLDEVIMRFVKDVIRTEKLKLLDEVVHQSTINLKSAKAVAGWAELRKKQLEAEL